MITPPPPPPRSKHTLLLDNPTYQNHDLLGFLLYLINPPPYKHTHTTVTHLIRIVTR